MGNVDFVKNMLEKKADPNLFHPYLKKSPIHFAIIMENLEILKLLDSYGSNFEILNEKIKLILTFRKSLVHCIYISFQPSL